MSRLISRKVQVALLFILFLTHNVQADTSLAIVQLRPANIDAVGFDSDFTLAMRSVMEKNRTLRLVSRRDMDDELRRQGLIQDDKVNTAIRVGQVLSVPYVIIGTVRKQQFAFSVDISVIDVLAQARIERLAITLDNRNQLEAKAQEAVSRITAVLEENNTKTDIFSGNYSSTQETSSSLSSDIVSFIDATASSEGVRVIWQAAQPSDKYNIYRASYSEGPFQFLSVTRDAEFFDSRPLEGDNYYQIAIVDRNNLEIRSQFKGKATYNAQEANTEIRAPTILSIKASVGATNIEFLPSLLNDAPIAYYNVYRRKDNESQWNLISNVSANSSGGAAINDLNYLDKNLEAGTRYHYRLTSVSNSGSEGSPSPEQSVSLPAAPELSHDGQIRFREARMSWTPSMTGSGYRLYRQKLGSTQWQLISDKLKLAQTSFVDTTDLADGETYQYSITVFDKISESAKSEMITITTRSAFAAPDGLTASMGLLKKVELNWTPIDDVNVLGYGIYRGLDELNSQEQYDVHQIARIDSRSISQYTDTGDEKVTLEDGKTYVYAVSTFLANGEESTLSPAQKGITKSAPEIAIPVDIEVVNNNLRVSWTVDENFQETWRMVLAKQWRGHSWEPVDSFSKDIQEFNDTELKPYSEIRYRLTVEDSDGLQSAPVMTDYFSSPREITLLSDTSSGVRLAKLFWDEQQLVDGYYLYRKPETSDNWRKVAEIKSPSQTQHVDRQGLQDGIIYNYSISAFDKVSESPKSNTVQIRTLPAPVAPAGFSATSGEFRKVTLSWERTTEEHANAYRIYKLEGDEYKLIETIKDINVTEYVDDGGFFAKLKDDTEYLYAISALNAFEGEGEKSEMILATTKSAPFAPSNLSGVLVGNTIELTWDSSVTSDVVTYSVLRSRGSCSSLRKFKNVNASNNLFVDDNIAPGKTYCYNLKAVDSDGLESTVISPISVSVPLPEGVSQ